MEGAWHRDSLAVEGLGEALRQAGVAQVQRGVAGVGSELMDYLRCVGRGEVR